ncbi:hypothetical protein RQP46_005990 [Phenoliferia psychrophenolica]
MTTVSVGNLGVSDPLHEPRRSDKELEATLGQAPDYEVAKKGPKPSFHEYLFHASLRREAEDNDHSIVTSKGIGQLFAKKEKSEKGEKDGDVVVVHETEHEGSDDLAGMTESQIEYLNARRALRLAGWGTVFYLITCDILGPFNAPYAIASIGIVPGVLLYILFGAVAAITGGMLSRLFLRLDSVRHPVKTYGDLAERVFGMWARHLCTFLQSIQLVLNVGIIIRGLQNFGMLANSSVWLNMLIIFLSMFNMVFAYGGAMIFPEIMAEMRPPRDFIKGMAMAQTLIFTLYLLYGVFVYCYQGQYTISVAYQGISRYAWQTIANVMGLVTGLIAAGLYGNIGLKVLYINVVEDLCKGPALTSRMGKILWVPLVFIYWAIAFVLGSAIPSVGTLSGLVSAMAIFQFTYTFPPALMLGFDILVDGAAEDEPFTTPGVAPRRADTWSSMARWKRGILGGGRKRVSFKVANCLFLLAALATAGLGLWATVRFISRQTTTTGL